MGGLGPDDLRPLLGAEGRLLADTARQAPDATPIAAASGRTAGQTVRHLTDAYDDALARLTAGQGGHGRAATAGSPAVPADRFVDRLAALLAEFGTRSPWESCSTWWPADGTVRFWLRRLTHATALARVDLQSALGGRADPVPPSLAEDGIAEVLRLWFHYRLSVLRIAGTRPNVVHVRTRANSWVVCIDQNGVDLVPPRDGPREVDAVVTGVPERVYLWLWGRLPDRAVEITGDVAATAQLWGLLRLATHGTA